MDAATEPRAAQRSSAQTSRALLLLLTVLTATGPVALNILVPAVPQLVALLQTDVATVQLTVSLFLLSLAAAQLVLGPLSDKLGRRPVVLGGLVLATLASFAAIAASSIGWLIAARVMQALGASTGIVIGRAIIRDLYERERAAAMIGLVTTVMVMVPMFAPALGGVLDTAFGWQSIFLFLGVFYAAVLLWSVRGLPETRVFAGAGTNLMRDWKTLLKSASFHGYVLCGAFGTAQFFIFIGGGSHVVVSMMGKTSAEYGLWFMITSVGYMGGNFIASRFSQRLGVHKMIVAGLAIEIAAVIVEALGIAVLGPVTPAIIFVPQIFISLGNGMMLPNAVAGAVSVVPHASGAASGIVGFSQFAVGAASAQLISMLLAGAMTPMAMPLLTLGTLLIAAGCYSALAVSRRSA
jgi:DHA1 family bicyclomycin/chloramphenicol resistance-like MFS transporter